MNISTKSFVIACSICCLSSMSASAQAVPEKPSNLKADANYSSVNLSWEIPYELKELVSESFEGEKFPPIGWSVKETNTNGKDGTNPINMYSWFAYPTKYMDSDIDDTWILDGFKSAVITPDMGAPYDDESILGFQDEWLMTPKTAGAEYVKFQTYIDPTVLEYGADPKFPDHYYVKVSHDEGATWEVLWDARYDSNCVNGVCEVTLYLGDSSKGDAIVAFQVLSDENEKRNSAYFSWSVDNVRLYGVNDNSSATGVAADSYNIYLDNTLIAKGVKATSYLDNSNKESGKHTYAVEAVSLANNTVSEKSVVEVEIENAITNAPKNVKLTSSVNADDSNKYDINITWEAPDGDRKPSSYFVYCNNALVAGYMESLEYGQTLKPKGVFTYSVVAHYENPEGVSEPSKATIAVGARPVVSELNYSLVEEGGDVTLTWIAPEASENKVAGYAVYRGNEKLTQTNDLTYVDANAPEGLYDYSVKVVYEDGQLSLPVIVTVDNGMIPDYPLPFSEDFTGGLTPANWEIEKIDGKLQDQYLWRFDNWYDLPVEGGNFSGDFASIASSVAGMSHVWVVLETPPIVAENIAENESVILEFDMCYDAQGQSSVASLNYSIDKIEWAYVGDGNFETTDGEPEHFEYDVTQFFNNGGYPIFFAWEYKGKIAQYMAIDNVKVYKRDNSSVSDLNIDKINYVVDGDAINVSGAKAVKVYSIDGVCTASIESNGAEVSLPLGNAINIVEIATDNGSKTIKVVR